MTDPKREITVWTTADEADHGEAGQPAGVTIDETNDLRERVTEYLERTESFFTPDEIMEDPEMLEVTMQLILKEQELERRIREREEREAAEAAEREARKQEMEEQCRKAAERKAKKQEFLKKMAEATAKVDEDLRGVTPADLSDFTTASVTEDHTPAEELRALSIVTAVHPLQETYGELLPELVFQERHAAAAYRGWLAMHHRRLLEQRDYADPSDPLMTAIQTRHEDFQRHFEAIEAVIQEVHGADLHRDHCPGELFPEYRSCFEQDWLSAFLAERVRLEEKQPASTVTDVSRGVTDLQVHAAVADQRDRYYRAVIEFVEATGVQHHAAAQILKRLIRKIVTPETYTDLPEVGEALTEMAIARQVEAFEKGQVESGDVHQTARFLASTVDIDDAGLLRLVESELAPASTGA